MLHIRLQTLTSLAIIITVIVVVIIVGVGVEVAFVGAKATQQGLEVKIIIDLMIWFCENKALEISA